MALIISMFIKAAIVSGMLPNKIEAKPIIKLPVIELKKENKLKYQEVAIAETNIKKPFFSNKSLDTKIDEYISNNSCETLKYNYYDLGKNRVSVFLNCGTPKSILYDYKNNEEITFKSLLTDYQKFIEESKRLLKLKYPTFVVEDISFENATYDIYENEIVGYYNSPEYGSATYKINYNEVKDLMDFSVSYDESYENEVYKLDPNKKSIAFTYDDGPSSYDLELLEILRNSHSTATFFVVGNRLNNYPKVVDALAKSKMEVGNHTYDHKSLTKLSNEKILEQITKTNNLYYSMTNKSINMLRPSYGAVNKKVLIQVGMPVILWSIDTLDWKTRNANKVYDEIMTNAKDGDIVLMHSLYKSTVEATDRAVKALYKEGYQIVSVSELASLKNRELTVGNSYLSLK